MGEDSKEKGKRFWGNLWSQLRSAGKSIGNWIVRYPLALLISAIVIIVGTFFLFTGKGEKFNWGGIISKLFGKDSDAKTNVKIANKVPLGRKEKKEKVGKHGYKQEKVEKLPQSNNPFRDKSKIQIKEDGEKKKVKLPQGVEDKDVREVYRIKPDSYTVRVRSKPEDTDLDELEKSLK